VRALQRTRRGPLDPPGGDVEDPREAHDDREPDLAPASRSSSRSACSVTRTRASYRNPALTDRNHPEQKRLVQKLVELHAIAHPEG
jgi:hypothetical protein